MSGPDAHGVDSRPQPATLYHYTDARGLLGIVESRALWATGFRYLNHGEELLYPYQSLLAELEGYEFPLLAAVKSRLDQICMARAADPTGGVFVACLSASRDEAGQWARHGGDSGGFALRFDVERLTGTSGYAATSEHGMLRMRLRDGPREVGYGDDWRDREVERMAGMLSSTNGGSGFDIIDAGLAASLLDDLARIKHGGFLAEREWRLVAHAVVQTVVRHNSRMIAQSVSATSRCQATRDRVGSAGAVCRHRVRAACARRGHRRAHRDAGASAGQRGETAAVRRLPPRQGVRVADSVPRRAIGRFPVSRRVCGWRRLHGVSRRSAHSRRRQCITCRCAQAPVPSCTGASVGHRGSVRCR